MTGETTAADDGEKPEPDQTVTEPNGDGDDVDWKAKYEETLNHSRQWERRAKANVADARAKAEAEAKVAEMQERIDRLENEKKLDAARKAASEKYNVPASMLNLAVDEEQVEAFAKQLADWHKTSSSNLLRDAEKIASRHPIDQSGNVDIDEFLRGSIKHGRTH